VPQRTRAPAEFGRSYATTPLEAVPTTISLSASASMFATVGAPSPPFHVPAGNDAGSATD
jgi:hypothetical protein